MWTGGMHPRGGEPSKYNPWETWVNNRDIDLTDTTRYHIDGSWLDNGEYSDKINKDLLNNRWFMVYLVVNNTSDTEVVRSTIEINIERI